MQDVARSARRESRFAETNNSPRKGETSVPSTTHRMLIRALVSAGVLAVSIGVVGVWETRYGTVLSALTDASAPEFAYSGDSGPGFWAETPGWEACAGTADTQRQSPINIDRVAVDRHLGPL